MEEPALARGTALAPRFVGRRAELEVLTDRLHRLAGGFGGIVVIEGVPGVGTSRLIQEALRQAGRDVRVLHSAGRGHRLTRSLVPELGAGTRNAAASVARELARLAREVPVALVLEDLDRADPAFLSLVQPVAAHLEDQAVLLVVTARPAPRPPGLDQLLADLVTDGATRLRLRGLDPVETTLLATAVAGADPEAARAVLARTGGNPQLVVELVRALMADGVLAGRAEVPPGLPASLRPLVLGWLARLPRSTVDLLRMAAVLGPRLEVTHLARFIGEPAVRLLPRLEDALLAGVLDQVGPHLTIRPELIRDALYDDIVPAIRSALHVEASRVLAEAGAPTSTLAEHLVSAAATGDPAVLRRLRAAAQDKLGGSPAAAADLLRRALDGAGPELRDALLGDLAVAKLWSGRPGEAERIAREFLERPHDPVIGDTVRPWCWSRRCATMAGTRRPSGKPQPCSPKRTCPPGSGPGCARNTRTRSCSTVTRPAPVTPQPRPPGRRTSSGTPAQPRWPGPRWLASRSRRGAPSSPWRSRPAPWSAPAGTGLRPPVTPKPWRSTGTPSPRR